MVCVSSFCTRRHPSVQLKDVVKGLQLTMKNILANQFVAISAFKPMEENNSSSFKFPESYLEVVERVGRDGEYANGEGLWKYSWKAD